MVNNRFPELSAAREAFLGQENKLPPKQVQAKEVVSFSGVVESLPWRRSHSLQEPSYRRRRQSPLVSLILRSMDIRAQLATTISRIGARAYR